MNEIKDYVLKKYPTRFKTNDEINIEERETHYVVYVKDRSPVCLNKKAFV